MSKIQRGLCWAASLILLALGNRFGLVADDAANTLFIVLPILAVMSVRGSNSCAGKLAA
jgi:hypothetical protein